MMSVVIDNHDSVHFTFCLETPTGARKAMKSFGDLFKRHFQLETHCDCGQRVVDVVHARYTQLHLANHVRAAPHTETRSEIVVVTDAMRGDVSLRAQAVSHAPPCQ